MLRRPMRSGPNAEPVFSIDTNILIHAAQSRSDPRKARAIDVVARAALADSILPVQALAEFANACRKKGLLETAIIAARVSDWSQGFAMVAVVAGDVGEALVMTARFSLSFYDALLCATVRRAGATVLLSEDMGDGAMLDGLRVVNPFAEANAGVVAQLLGQN